MIELIDFCDLDLFSKRAVTTARGRRRSWRHQDKMEVLPTVGQLLCEEQEMCEQVPGRRWKGLPSRTLRVVDMCLLQEERRG